MIVNYNLLCSGMHFYCIGNKYSFSMHDMFICVISQGQDRLRISSAMARILFTRSGDEGMSQQDVWVGGQATGM